MKILYISPNKEEIVISSSFYKTIEEKDIPGWSDGKDKRYNLFHNMYKIKVVHEGKEETFNFYDSINNYEKRLKDLSAYDLLMSFSCILSDSLSGNMDICEFMSEYGYTECKRAKLILSLCKRTKEKIDSFNFMDIYDILNHISEAENNDKIEEIIKEL